MIMRIYAVYDLEFELGTGTLFCSADNMTQARAKLKPVIEEALSEVENKEWLEQNGKTVAAYLKSITVYNDDFFVVADDGEISEFKKIRSCDED